MDNVGTEYIFFKWIPMYSNDRIFPINTNQMSNIPNMFSVHQLLNCVVIIFPNPMNTLLRIMANKLKIYLNGFYDRSIRPGMYICPLCKYKSRTCSLIFWANEIIEIEFWVGRKFWEHEVGTFKIIKSFFDVFLCTKMISKYLASIIEVWSLTRM